MKKKILLTIIVFINSVCIGQKFQNSIYNPDGDFNHFSIATIPNDNSYVIAGTLFGSVGNDMYIMKLNDHGYIKWELRLGASIDDRLLDVTIGMNDNIIITGYSYDQTTDMNTLYIAEIDISGILIQEKLIPITGSYDMNSAGTNIIYHEETDSYIIGGFLSNGNFYNLPSLQDHRSFVLSLSSDFTRVNWCNTFFENSDPTLRTQNVINDIIKINSDELFVTGGLDYDNGYGQGVLALILDVNTGNIQHNISFTNIYTVESWHLGASCYYDGESDQIYLLSNNGFYHNPQITTIKNISSSPFIDKNRYLLLGLGGTSTGFQIMPNEDNLPVVVGGDQYGYRFFSATVTNNLLPAGLAKLADHVAINFENHGGPLFSSFNMLHTKQYIYNQEIMTRHINGFDLVAIGPLKDIRTLNKYGLDLFSATLLNKKCSDTIPFTMYDIPFRDLIVNEQIENPIIDDFTQAKPPINSKQYQSCCSFVPFTSFHDAIPDIFSTVVATDITTGIPLGKPLDEADVEYDDIDNDGVVDIVYPKSKELHVIKGVNVGGNIVHNLPSISLSIFNCYSHRLFDWDNDGDKDIIAATTFLGQEGIFLFDNTGSGVINTTPTMLLEAPTEMPAHSQRDIRYIEVGDLNGDNLPDILIGVENTVAFYKNVGGGLMTLSGSQNYNSSTGHYSSAFITLPMTINFAVPELFDIDCDNDLDLFISFPITLTSPTTVTGGRVYFHENNGPTTAALPNINTTGLINQFGLNDQTTNDLVGEVVVTRFVETCKDADNIIAIAHNPYLAKLFYYRSAPTTYCPSTKSSQSTTNVQKSSPDFNKIVLYPNPTTDFINIASTEKVLKLSIYNVSGKLVKEINSPDNTITINDLAKGMYYIEIFSIYSKKAYKIIKQ